MNDFVKKVLTIECSKTGKLCLVVMAAHLNQTQWRVTEFADIIGSEPKTIRIALKELLALKLINVVGQNIVNAYIYELNLFAIDELTASASATRGQSDLAALKRQVQVNRTRRSKKSEL
jgi:hypothetical protein